MRKKGRRTRGNGRPTQMCQYDRIHFWKISGDRVAEGQVDKVNEEEEKAWERRIEEGED